MIQNTKGKNSKKTPKLHKFNSEKYSLLLWITFYPHYRFQCQSLVHDFYWDKSLQCYIKKNNTQKTHRNERNGSCPFLKGNKHPYKNMFYVHIYRCQYRIFAQYPMCREQILNLLQKLFKEKKNNHKVETINYSTLCIYAILEHKLRK